MGGAVRAEPLSGEAMRLGFRRAMDALYLVCVFLSGLSLVLISAIIPWSVYTRYIVNRAASWPEPMAVLLTIVLTFFGAAACYRVGMHMRVTVLVDLLPAPARQAQALIVELVMGLLGLFMAVWGARLVEATWHQSIAEFPFLSVGVTYLPIPIGGAMLLLFVVERLAIGAPPGPAAVVGRLSGRAPLSRGKGDPWIS
jgi:TRAP-type C4-dicarboxylate transport system permease small subunit